MIILYSPTHPHPDEMTREQRREIDDVVFDYNCRGQPRNTLRNLFLAAYGIDDYEQAWPIKGNKIILREWITTT